MTVSELKINGESVERVDEYKYLDTIIDSQLNFNSNTDHTHKKAVSECLALPCFALPGLALLCLVP